YWESYLRISIAYGRQNEFLRSFRFLPRSVIGSLTQTANPPSRLRRWNLSKPFLATQRRVRRYSGDGSLLTGKRRNPGRRCTSEPAWSGGRAVLNSLLARRPARLQRRDAFRAWHRN